MNKQIKVLLVLIVISAISFYFLQSYSEDIVKSNGLIETEQRESTMPTKPIYKENLPDDNEEVLQALFKSVNADGSLEALISVQETQTYEQKSYPLNESVTILKRVMKRDQTFEESAITISDIPLDGPLYLLMQDEQLVEVVYLDWSNLM